MSAPTPAPGEDRPREGWYPDPSIPGYVRYWNGSAWVPGTSRPAPAKGERLGPPPGVRPAPPAAVEETGPHFFDEDPPESAPEPDPAPGEPAPAWGAVPSQQSGPGGDRDRRVSWGADPRISHMAQARPSGTPGDDSGAPAPAAPVDRKTMTFRPVAPKTFPAQGASAPGTPGGTAGTSASAGPSGPGFGAGRAAAERAAARSQAGAASPQAPAPAANPAAPASPLPQQPGVPQAASAPLTSGPGGGQPSWAQQAQQPAGTVGEQPVVPWRPPVEDPFQAAARQRAAARPAGLGKRVAARIVDSLVVGGVTAVAAVPLGAKAVDHINDKIEAAKLSGRTVTVWLLDGTTGTYLGIVLAVLLLFGVLYEVLPTVKWGRTLGKKLCGLEVRDIEAHEYPTFGAALRRWLVYSVPGLLGIGLVGLVWCLFDKPWHQCWHDKAAHTFVAG